MLYIAIPTLVADSDERGDERGDERVGKICVRREVGGGGGQVVEPTEALVDAGRTQHRSGRSPQQRSAADCRRAG